MNKHLENFARNFIRVGLVRLPETNRYVFKLMYGMNRGRRSVAEAAALTTDQVVAEVPVGKLEQAMDHIEATFVNYEREAAQAILAEV